MLPTTPTAAASASTNRSTPPRGNPSTRRSACSARRRVTSSDCVEKTRKPPVKSATSASTFKFTRYARDRFAPLSCTASTVVTYAPAGRIVAILACICVRSAPGASRRSMRFNSPSRPRRHWAVATSVSAAIPRKLDAGSTPATSRSTVCRAAMICSLLPFCNDNASAAAAERRTASGFSSSKRRAGSSAKSAGWICAARRASIPTNRIVLFLSPSPASTSSTGLATATPSSFESAGYSASGNPARPPRTSRSASPDSDRVPAAISSTADRLIRLTAKPSATPSAIPVIDSSVRPARSRNLAFSAANNLVTRLAGAIPDQDDPVHRAAKAVIVVDCVVLGAAVVPERDRARLPGKPAGEFRPRLVLVEILEDRRAFADAHAGEAQRMCLVDVQCLATRLRMGAHDWMLGAQLASSIVATVRARAIPVAQPDEALRRRMNRFQLRKHPLHAGRERLEGKRRVGEQRVAAARRDLARDEHRPHWRFVQVDRVGMPDRTEGIALSLELFHLDDRREAGDPLHQGVLDRHAEAFGKRKKLARRDVLVAQENHVVFQPRGAQYSHLIAGKRPGKIDSAHLCAQGT